MTTASTGPPDPSAPRDGKVRSYYGRPVVKEPEWTWEVPWYLFAGGLGGASSTLSVVASLRRNPELARSARLVAGAAAAVSPPLLVADLGRPKRFLNMLRVFKPTSVMSVGSWTLAAYSSAAVGGAGLELIGRLPRVRRLLDAGSGLLGLVMATYTGALVADSSIPVWHEGRRHLPGLFAASSLASAGAASALFSPAERAAPALRIAVAGAAAEVVIDRLMARHLGDLGAVYTRERSGRFHRAATVATTIGASLMALGGRRRRRLNAAGAVALLAGSVCLRWSVYEAGFQSARDPRAVIGPQRARLGSRHVSGDRRLPPGRDAATGQRKGWRARPARLDPG